MKLLGFAQENTLCRYCCMYFLGAFVLAISAYTRWNCLATTDASKSRSTPTKYHCPVCTRNVTSRGVSYKCTRCSGWVHAECSGILNAAQYLRKVIGPASPARPHRSSNQHHQLYHMLRLLNRSVTTARSTSYNSTLTESGTS